MKKINPLFIIACVLALFLVITVSAQYFVTDAADENAVAADNSDENNMQTTASIDTNVGVGDEDSMPSQEFMMSNQTNQSLQVSFIPPTEQNGAVLNRNYFYINARALPRSQVQYLYIYIYHENRYKWIRTRSNHLSIRVINAEEGQYSFRAIAVDKSGRNVSTPLRRITITDLPGGGGGNNTRPCNVTQIPARCNDGTITSDEYEDGCRTIVCSADSDTLKVLACDKPTNIEPRYLELFAAQGTTRDLRICLDGICVTRDRSFARARYSSRCTG